MKLFSKIISAVAALSMVATMAVMPVAHAAVPVLKLTATPSDTYVDLTVSYTGADAKMSNSGIKVYIGEGFAPAECPEDYEGSYWDAMLDGEMEGWSTAKTGLDGVTFAVQATQIVFATATSKTTAKATLDASCDNLFTVRLYPTKKYDPTADYQFEFTGQNTLSSYKDYQDTLVLDVTDAKIAGSGSAVTEYAVTAGTGIESVDKTEAAEGDTVNFTVVEADTGKELTDIQVNGESIGADATSFTMPAAAATVTAVFDWIDYDIEASNEITVAETAHYGDTVNFTVNVPDGKEISDITVNGASIGKDATSFTMPADHVELVVTFVDVVIPDPDPEATFETKEASADNAVGFAATIKSLLNASEITRAGFVFANVNDKYDEATPVDTTLRTDPIDVKGTFAVDSAFTYEFKNLTGFDKFGLMAIPYVVTDKGIAWGKAFGEIIPIVK